MRAFDIVGNIAIIEVPKGQSGKELAQNILKQKHIKSVYKKMGGHEGRQRIQKLRHVAGENKTETIHRENGVALKLDIARVYFSPRQATERQRVYSQIKKPEKVLVMFSGIGPFGIEIAKHTPATVIGVELNKKAHKYAEENAKLNKVQNKTTFIQGDVKNAVPSLGKFDRIIMPLPKGAEPYLTLAKVAAKKNAIIHFYGFEKEEDIPQAAVEKIINIFPKARILNVAKCGQLGVRQYRVCVDFKISSQQK